MTELEIMQRAKMYMDKLAQGIDPITDREVPEDSVLNNVRLARCFFYVSGVLQQVIDRGGSVERLAKNQPGIVITPQLLEQLHPTDRAVRISEFIGMLMEASGDPNGKRPGPTIFSNWLMEKGLMAKVMGENGKQQRLPTEAGKQVGIYSESYQGVNGTYVGVFYSPEAQQFLIDHLQDIFA